MPCPYFEPRLAVQHSTISNARLPLIEEYEGECRAGPDVTSPDEAARFRYCNHGNAAKACANFPKNEKRSCIRFDVLARTNQQIELLLIEESSYEPMNWRRHSLLIESERIEPDLNDACQRAQMLAFCRSYLRRFPL